MDIYYFIDSLFNLQALADYVDSCCHGDWCRDRGGFPRGDQRLKSAEPDICVAGENNYRTDSFSILVVGIEGNSDLKQVGRMDWKSIVYFEIVTTIALIIGLIATNGKVNLTRRRH